jgi:hypothetical protein
LSFTTSVTALSIAGWSLFGHKSPGWQNLLTSQPSGGAVDEIGSPFTILWFGAKIGQGRGGVVIRERNNDPVLLYICAMDVFVIIFSLFTALTGWLMKAQPNLISGYNTMSAEKKKNVDIQAVGNLFCKGFLLAGTSMIALYAIFNWLLDMPAVAQGVWLAPILIITPVLIVMAQKYDKNPRGRFAKYWAACLVGALTVGIVIMIVWGVQPTKAIVEGDAVRFTGQYGVIVQSYLFIETKKGEKIIFNSPDPALMEDLFEAVSP